MLRFNCSLSEKRKEMYVECNFKEFEKRTQRVSIWAGGGKLRTSIVGEGATNFLFAVLLELSSV